jgi:uncharacterized membrane protein
VSLRFAQVASLLAATITTGLMAGVFGIFAHTIMRGLGKTDDRTFVGAFQAIDRAIINPLFMLTFFSALIFSGVAAVLYFRHDGRSVLPWVITAFVLYLVVVIITVAVHVPLNDDIKAAGDPERIADLAAVREQFHETRWVAWKHRSRHSDHGRVRLPRLGVRITRTHDENHRGTRAPGCRRPSRVGFGARHPFGDAVTYQHIQATLAPCRGQRSSASRVRRASSSSVGWSKSNDPRSSSPARR